MGVFNSANRIGGFGFDDHSGGVTDWVHLLGCQEGDGLQLFGSCSFHKPPGPDLLRFYSGNTLRLFLLHGQS